MRVPAVEIFVAGLFDRVKLSALKMSYLPGPMTFGTFTGRLDPIVMGFASPPNGLLG